MSKRRRLMFRCRTVVLCVFMCLVLVALKAVETIANITSSQDPLRTLEHLEYQFIQFDDTIAIRNNYYLSYNGVVTHSASWGVGYLPVTSSHNGPSGGWDALWDAYTDTFNAGDYPHVDNPNPNGQIQPFMKGSMNQDWDGDGIVNGLDDDADGDGVPDNVDEFFGAENWGQLPTSGEPDDRPVPDDLDDAASDTNGDGVTDENDILPDEQISVHYDNFIYFLEGKFELEKFYPLFYNTIQQDTHSGAFEIENAIGNNTITVPFDFGDYSNSWWVIVGRASMALYMAFLTLTNCSRAVRQW